MVQPSGIVSVFSAVRLESREITAGFLQGQKDEAHSIGR